MPNNAVSAFFERPRRVHVLTDESCGCARFGTRTREYTVQVGKDAPPAVWMFICCGQVCF